MFGENLKKLRENAGLSQEQLGSIVGVSKSTIGMYEQGKRMPNTNTILKELASYFDVTLDYLVGYPGKDFVPQDDDFERFNLRPVRCRQIPMLGKVACGQPIMSDVGYNSFSESGSDIDADFCVTAQGDSMINARILDGDIVFVRRQEMVENGEIAVVAINDSEFTLKRFFYYQELNQVVLQSENPAYRPMVFTGEDLNHIRVLGKAIIFSSRVI